MKPNVLLFGRSAGLLKGLMTYQLKKEDSYLMVTYQDYAKHLLKNKGKVWTGKHLKQLYTLAHRYSMRQVITPMPFTKSDKEGFPKVLKPYKKLLRGTPGEIQSVLTLLCQYRLFYGDADRNVKTITDSGSPMDKWKLLRCSWLEFLEKFKSKNPVSNIKDSKPLLRGSSGPNGPSMTTILKDAYAVSKSPEVHNSLIELSKFIKTKTLRHVNKYSEIVEKDKSIDKSKLCHSRLAFLPEGGIKTRVIAIGDYFTQELLKPIHDVFMEALGRIKSDGTYSHDKIGDKALKLTELKRKSYCYDLSSATDRFPIELISDLMTVYFNKDLSSAWANVMVKRDFKVPDGNNVRYQRGQPMGFYSSWATFAMTHHALVQFSGYLEGYNTFSDYLMIGDDIVINNTKVAGRYKELLTILEVPISFDKSIVPCEDNHYPCEIAKRLFLNGNEISPFPPDILKSCGGNYLLVPQLLKVMNQRGFFDKVFIKDQLASVSLEFIIQSYPERLRKNVMILLSNPLIGAGAPNLNWGNDDHPWKGHDLDEIKTVTKQIINEMLDKRISKLMRELEKFWHNHQYSDPSPIFVWAGLPISVASTDCSDDHPMLIALSKIIEKLEHFQLSFNNKDFEPESYEALLETIIYIPDINMRSFRSLGCKREYIRSSITLDVFRRLKGETKKPTPPTGPEKLLDILNTDTYDFSGW